MSDTPPSKSVFISFVPEDAAVAQKLYDSIDGLLGTSVWLRSIELKAGTLIAEAINSAINVAKWFILILSESSLANTWIRAEANLATLRSIEDEDFAVVLVRIDASPVPPHINRVIKTYRVIDLATTPDADDQFANLAVDINTIESTRSQNRVFVDRGHDGDHFALSSRRNRIMVVVGWAGIGKSAFVKNTVAEKLGKDALTVTLTRGYSTDMLARQILHEAHVAQPIGQSLSDPQWLAQAISAVQQRSNNFFLFVDNGEEAIDPAGHFLPYLEEFLIAFARSKIRTHVVIATTRTPEYPAEIASDTDFLPLEALGDEFIREAIDLLLEGSPRQSDVMAASELDDIIQAIGGHPLAAKMVAALLKSTHPAQLLRGSQTRRIQLRLAEYMLRASNHRLTETHRLLLQVLAAIGEPVLLQDMLSVRELAEVPLEEIQTARWELADWFLIEQRGDLIYLSKFFAAFFREQLALYKGRFEKVAREFGQYALERAIHLNNSLGAIPLYTDGENGEAATLSGEVFRYAIPCARLLRAIGDDEAASRLPLEVKGTLREMVFHLYQVQQDYRSALSYANRWLALSPNDLDIMLYRIRCHRNLGNPDNLATADRLISQLESESRDVKRGFSARLLREKAIVAERRGETGLAKVFFKQGIEADRMRTYPDNHIGLAQILLREVDESPPNDPIAIASGQEALRLLENAREISSTFDRFHLGLYVEALIEAGNDDAALPLLELAIQERPNDSRLNYRMGEILRRRNELVEAERFALKALNFGAKKASITLANIYFKMGVDLQAAGDRILADARFSEAIRALDHFHPEFGHDQEVADGLACKVLCSLGDYASASARIMKYEDPNNPYTLYEQCRVEQRQSEQALARQAPQTAAVHLRSAIDRIQRFRTLRPLSQQLNELLAELTERESSVIQILGAY